MKKLEFPGFKKKKKLKTLYKLERYDITNDKIYYRLNICKKKIRRDDDGAR